MPLPVTTYRVQLHAGFGFSDAASLVPYLRELGVTHLYCSPSLQAAPHSTHGYDVVDPRRLSAELGGEEGHERLGAALSSAGLGAVLDIVPNHMATDPSNPFWWDVLENGPRSRHAAVFDIDWASGNERVLVPLLGDHYGRVLEAGEIRIEHANARFRLRYRDHLLPLAPDSLVDVLRAAARRAGGEMFAGIAEQLVALAAASAEWRSLREGEQPEHALFDDLGERLDADPELRRTLAAELDALNGDANRLDALVRRQNYRLAYWRVASEEIDYRRFFTIETLVGVRVEDPTVFALTHRRILDLVATRRVEGLRVDHVDGLRDPAEYLARLAGESGGCYTVVEKILEAGESLPAQFAVAGTSGYEFLARVNNVLVDPAGESEMTAAYADFVGGDVDYATVVHEAKQQVMADELTAEVDRLVALLSGICENHRRQRDQTRRELRDHLRTLVASYGVYRSYVRPGEAVRPADRRAIDEAVAEAHARRPDCDVELLAFLGSLARGEHSGALEVEFAVRLQQLTAPVMAKGVEDTAFYRYNRLVSLNEVGGDPGVFGRPLDAFHSDTAAIAACWPMTMLTLSTHDTKRSADVRARLHVLSEIPTAWRLAVSRWAERNGRHRLGGWPDPDAEYMLYQNMLGAWPIDGDRLSAFMAKATKEAKVHTSWTDPNREYDEAVDCFVRAVASDREFVADLEGFLADERIIERGRAKSLAQVALLYGCPGVADLYQGDEIWNLNLVDPDNRRPVDYATRRELLRSIDAGAPIAGVEEALGRAKMRLVQALGSFRRDHRELIASGEYEPLGLKGPAADATIAFARPGAVVVAPRVSAARLDETHVELPRGRWRDLVTGATAAGGWQSVAQLFAEFPVAVLARDGGA